MPIGAIVSGTVISHHTTGLLIELDGSRAEAAVETFYVSVPVADAPALPPVGSRVTGVVKGYRGSQLRMSLLPSDLDRARIPN
jgi:hypothetical protein